MGKLKVSGFVLLFSALVGLTTCQLQFNRAGNSVALRVLIPGKLSGMTRGAFATASTPRSLAGGASLTVTIMQEGGSSSEQQMVSLNGQTSIDFSFTVSSSGSYQISALLQDVNAKILAQRTAQVELPANYPVVLPLYSSLLSDVIVTDS